MSKGDQRQFVRVEFARSLISIRPGEPAHPWHWCLIVQDGHVYAIGGHCATIAEALADFAEKGQPMLHDAERRLAEMYCEPGGEPYDLAQVNPKRV